MANFNIRQYRPLLQQQAVAYEKSTFDKFIENKRGEKKERRIFIEKQRRKRFDWISAMGIDPFASTYKWLERAFQRIKTKETIGWFPTPDDDSITNISILNEAFCELLLWNPKNPFPEVKKCSHSEE